MAKERKEELIFNWEEEADEMDLIGICSHYPTYKLAWELNHLFGFNLKESAQLLEVIPKKNKVQRFPYYFDYGKEEDYLEIYLVKNKHEREFLMPELSQIDYLLFYVNNQVYDLDELNKKIKNQSEKIIASFRFDTKKYDSTNNIIFERYEKDENNSNYGSGIFSKGSVGTDD